MTKNNADQLYDWPTVIPLIQTYGCIQIYGRHIHVWDIHTYGDIQIYGVHGVWRHMDICKKFSIPLIMNHVHHLSTEMEGQNV